MKSKFKIDKNGLGWYVEQVGTSNYLHTDGKIRDWYKDEQTEVYFNGKPEAEAALEKFIKKRKPKTKAKPKVKNKVNDIVSKLYVTLRSLTVALKELTDGKE